MRPYLPSQFEAVSSITARYPNVHGAPIFKGKDCAQIGITDVNKPDYGMAVSFLPEEEPVFWACGVTPANALKSASEIPLAFSHSPGKMLVTDLFNDELRVV